VTAGADAVMGILRCFLSGWLLYAERPHPLRSGLAESDVPNG